MFGHNFFLVTITHGGGGFLNIFSFLSSIERVTRTTWMRCDETMMPMPPVKLNHQTREAPEATGPAAVTWQRSDRSKEHLFHFWIIIIIILAVEMTYYSSSSDAARSIYKRNCHHI